MNKFSIEEAVGFGWKTVKEHWMTLVPITVVVGLVSTVLDRWVNPRGGMAFEDMTWDPSMMVGDFSRTMLSTMISVIFAAVLVRVCLNYVDGKVKNGESVFGGITPDKLLKVILASIIVNALIFIGFILLIIPGIYLALRFSQVTNAIMDKNMGVMEAMRESSRLTEGVKWNLIAFYIVCIVIVIAGLIALVIGVVIAAPVVAVATAHVYRQLTKSAGAAPVPAEA